MLLKLRGKPYLPSWREDDPPDIDADYLVAVFYGTIVTMGHWTFGKWWIRGEERADITHWAELPDPPVKE